MSLSVRRPPLFIVCDFKESEIVSTKDNKITFKLTYGMPQNDCGDHWRILLVISKHRMVIAGSLTGKC